MCTRFPVTRTSSSQPTAESWGHWNHTFSIGHSKHVFRNCFLLLRIWCFRNVWENKYVLKMCPTSQKLRFDFSELGELLLRTCLLACSPPPLVLYFLPLSNFILLFLPHFSERKFDARSKPGRTQKCASELPLPTCVKTSIVHPQRIPLSQSSHHQVTYMVNNAPTAIAHLLGDLRTLCTKKTSTKHVKNKKENINKRKKEESRSKHSSQH